MKKILVLMLALVAALPAFAAQYEMPFLNMVVPSGLEQNQMYFNFEHKFYQALNRYPSNDPFAVLNNGANLNVSLRYMPLEGLEVNAGYSSRQKEKLIGASYAMKMPALYFNWQAGLQFFSYEDTAFTQASQNLYYYIALQSVPFLEELLSVSLDLSYDGYEGMFGMAAGLSVAVIKNLSVVAEFYPYFEGGGEDTAVTSEKFPVYAFGLIYRTSGHQFMLKFSNSPEMGMRRMNCGADSLDLYAGISIMRLIEF